MKKHLALVIAALIASLVAGCVSQVTPKQKTTTQGLTSPRDPQSGLPTGP